MFAEFSSIYSGVTFFNSLYSSLVMKKKARNFNLFFGYDCAYIYSSIHKLN